jgi:phage shock protein PspC (stress-responsive transcriptional regulator)
MLLLVNYQGGKIMNETTQPHTGLESGGLAGARAWFSEKGLARRREQRVFTGVTGAFARRYEIDPFVARFVTVAAMIGLTPLPYLALWILMPFED